MTTRLLEAENSVLGSILIDPRVLPVVEAELNVEDFSTELHREIYRVALDLEHSGQPVDPVLIRDRLGADPAISSYLFQLMDTTPTAANIEAYIPLVREASQRRALDELCHLSSQRNKEMDGVEDIAVDLANGVDKLLQNGSSKDLFTTEDCISRFYDHRMEVDQSPEKAYVSTGYSQLNAVLAGGMINTGLYVLAARPGMGKTTMALNIVENVAKNGGGVMFVSLEMDDKQITAKRLARASGIPYNTLMMGRLTDTEYLKMTAAMEDLNKAPVSVNVKGSLNVDEILALTRKVKNLRLVCIDYFGLIDPGQKGRANRVEYTTEISGKLKRMAKKLGVPVLLLAQLNREVEKRAEKRPQLSDLRETGALEQDADAVIFLHRPTYYGDRTKMKPWDPEDLEVIVAKNRHGAVGECKMVCFMGVSKIQGGASGPRENYRNSMVNEI